MGEKKFNLVLLILLIAALASFQSCGNVLEGNGEPYEGISDDSDIFGGTSGPDILEPESTNPDADVLSDPTQGTQVPFEVTFLCQAADPMIAEISLGKQANASKALIADTQNIEKFFAFNFDGDQDVFEPLNGKVIIEVLSFDSPSLELTVRYRTDGDEPIFLTLSCRKTH